MTNVIDYVLEVQDRLTPTLNKINKNLSSFAPGRFRNLNGFFKHVLFEQFKGAVKFERQMVEITKVLDENFVSNIDNIKNLKNELRGISRVIPKSMDEIMAISAEGAKMGISGENIPGFTMGIAEVSRAFEITSEEAANRFIKVLSAFNKDVTYENISYLGGEMNEITNNMKAKGSELLAALNTSTAALFGSGLNEKQIIALNAAGLQVGLQPGVTGNALIKYAQMLNTIQETRAGRWALYDLGFSSKQWDILRENPELKNEEILKRLSALRIKGMEGDIKAQTKYWQVLKAMFGFYRAKDMDRIIAQLPEYEKALGLVSDEQKVQVSLQKELREVTDTLNDKIQLLKNSFEEFTGEITEMFIPFAKVVVDEMTDILEGAISRIRRFKNLGNKPFWDAAGDAIDNTLDIVRKGLAFFVGTAGTAAALTALGVSTPVVAPALVLAGGYGAYALDRYNNERLRGKGKTYIDKYLEKIEDSFNNYFDLDKKLDELSTIKEYPVVPITIKIDGTLKVPKEFEIEDLNFSSTTPVSNKNFSISLDPQRWSLNYD